MFSRLGVFIGCEGECREAQIAGELEGVLQERCLAGWKERDVRLSLLAIRQAFGLGPTSSAVARRHRWLCWAAVGFFAVGSQRASTAVRTTLSPLSKL